MSPTVGTAALLITFSNYPDFYPTFHFKRQIQNTWLNKSASLQVPVIQIGISPFFPPLKPKKILNLEGNKTVNYFPWWLGTILQCEFRYRLSTCWQGKKENSEIAALMFWSVYIHICERVCLFVSVINEMHVPGEEKPGSVHFWVPVVQRTVGAQLTFCCME